ncbi:coniferyl aldehyde dehydrogenase [soil metagenome]
MKNDSLAFDLENAFAVQHENSRRHITVAWEIRADRLCRLQTMLRNNRAPIAQAISDDFGYRSRQETEMLEFFACFEAIANALEHGKCWMRLQGRATGFWFLPGRSMVMPQPLGVVGIVSPWNYPLSLCVGPLASALAAGNRAMIKPSELTPRFAALFAELIHQSFDAAEVVVINGDAAVSQAFCALPFDHLLFTGSTAVGHHVMRAASDNLTPVTLELGGKSPAIIGPGADFEHAVKRIMAGKLLNAGQTCIAPDYVLLPAGQEQRFIESARKVVGDFYPQLNLQSTADAAIPAFTTIINDRHFARLQNLVMEASSIGAAVHLLSNAEPDPASRLMPPLALTGIPADAKIMSEEIFGPLLPLVGYASLDDALAYVTARARPLALYIFEREQAAIDKILQGTVAGGVTINDTLLHFSQEDLPFGGVGMSGMGAYHGRAGFDTFSHLKPVFRQSRINGMDLLNPPYGKKLEYMLKLLVRGK